MAIDAHPTRDAGRTLYGVFVGALVSLVLGLVTTTIFPHPEYRSGPDGEAGYDAVSLHRMFISLGLSLVVLIGGLFLAGRLGFLRSGLLLAAVINLIVGNYWVWSYHDSVIRLLAATASLVLAVIAGTIQFNRRSGRPAATSLIDGPPVFGSPVSGSRSEHGTVEARLSDLEFRLDAAASALYPAGSNPVQR